MDETDPAKMYAELIDRIDQAVREDGRYSPEAFEFLQQGLELASRMRHGEKAGSEPRHVSGQELSHALRLLAIQRWGPLTLEVLRRWGIRRTRDFGEMVYLMIDLDVFGKQDNDDISDFDNVYEFDEAFGEYRYGAEDAGGLEG